MSKIQHIVSYKANLDNPDAGYLIITHAKRYLAPLVENFTIGKPDSCIQRAVSDSQFDVVMMLEFNSLEEYKWYMSHEQHLEFVKFILYGWMVAGSNLPTVDERYQEFMDHILNGAEQKERAIDSEADSNKRVRAGELVQDIELQ